MDEQETYEVWDQMQHELDDINAELNVSDIYGRNFFTANDIPEGQEVTLTITDVRATLLAAHPANENQTPRKAAEFSFAEINKTFAPSKTVVYLLVGEFGPELTKWIGRKVTCFVKPWRQGGKSGVRVEWRPADDDVPKPKRKRSPRKRPA